MKELGDDAKTQEENQGSSSSKTGTGATTSSIPTYTSDLGTDTIFQLDEEQEQTQDPDQDHSGSSSLSYSAQIAKQFSSYSQTPSQERQQRPTVSHISAYESRTQNHSLVSGAAGGGDRPVRPSDMKDEG